MLPPWLTSGTVFLGFKASALFLQAYLLSLWPKKPPVFVSCGHKIHVSNCKFQYTFDPVCIRENPKQKSNQYKIQIFFC